MGYLKLDLKLSSIDEDGGDDDDDENGLGVTDISIAGDHGTKLACFLFLQLCQFSCMK